MTDYLDFVKENNLTVWLNTECPNIHLASSCEAPKRTFLLLTAVAPVIANGIKIQVNILFDEGAQHSVISVEMAIKLKISPQLSDIAMASFRTNSMTHQKWEVATIEETLSGEVSDIVYVAYCKQKLIWSSVIDGTIKADRN